MCLNCGCGHLDERHGNEANIVSADLRRAAEANGQDFGTTVTNLQASLDQLAGTHQRGMGWATGMEQASPAEVERPVSGGTEFASGAAGRPAREDADARLGTTSSSNR